MAGLLFRAAALPPVPQPPAAPPGLHLPAAQSHLPSAKEYQRLAARRPPCSRPAPPSCSSSCSRQASPRPSGRSRTRGAAYWAAPATSTRTPSPPPLPSASPSTPTSTPLAWTGGRARCAVPFALRCAAVLCRQPAGGQVGADAVAAGSCGMPMQRPAQPSAGGRRAGRWKPVTDRTRRTVGTPATPACPSAPTPSRRLLAPLAQYLRWYIDGQFVYEVNKYALVARTNGTGESKRSSDVVQGLDTRALECALAPHVTGVHACLPHGAHRLAQTARARRRRFPSTRSCVGCLLPACLPSHTARHCCPRAKCRRVRGTPHHPPGGGVCHLQCGLCMRQLPSA